MVRNEEAFRSTGCNHGSSFGGREGILEGKKGADKSNRLKITGISLDQDIKFEGPFVLADPDGGEGGGRNMQIREKKG